MPHPVLTTTLAQYKASHVENVNNVLFCMVNMHQKRYGQIFITELYLWQVLGD